MRRQALAEPDFSGRTFFEAVSLASREAVFSAVIAWILDDVSSPLSFAERADILESLGASVPSNVSNISATTEEDEIDIIVEMKESSASNRIVKKLAIENKIKSNQSKGQLAKYDRKLDDPSSDVEKILLTVHGENPESGSGWRVLSYGKILSSLRRFTLKSKPLEEFCLSLERLLFLSEKISADDKKIVKSAFDRDNDPEKSEVIRYIEQMRLKVLLQKIWMNELSKIIQRPSSIWRIRIGETRGSALLDIERELESEHCVAGIQLQNWSIKVFCRPEPYEKPGNNQKLSSCEHVINEMRKNMNLEHHKISIPRERGFRSFQVYAINVEMSMGEIAKKINSTLRKADKILASINRANGYSQAHSRALMRMRNASSL